MTKAKIYFKSLGKTMDANVSLYFNKIIVEYTEHTQTRKIIDIEDITRVDVFSPDLVVIISKSVDWSLQVDVAFFNQWRKQLPKTTTVAEGKSFKGPWIILMSILLGLISLILFIWLVLIPLIVDYGVNKISIETEAKIGDALFSSMIGSFKQDSIGTIYIQRFYDHLNIQSPYQVKVFLVESNEINAFAMPGGYIVVHDSILKLMEKPEELASLLLHEYSHIELRHSLKTMVNQASTYIAIILLVGNTGDLSALLLQKANDLKNLQYSRQLEKEADMNGIRLMLKSGINPKGSISLFEKLQNKTGNHQSEFLSTHPLFETRLNYIKSIVDTSSYNIQTMIDLEKSWNDLKTLD